MQELKDKIKQEINDLIAKGKPREEAIQEVIKKEIQLFERDLNVFKVKLTQDNID